MTTVIEFNQVGEMLSGEYGTEQGIPFLIRNRLNMLAFGPEMTY